jgi:prefoldin subunit 5
MKLHLLRIISVGVIVFLLSGCATMSDSMRTKSEGTGLGVLVGAAAGGAIGFLVGGKEGAALGAGIGAGVGALGGYWWGSTVAERKAEYATAEDMLDGEISVVAGYNSKIKNYNDQQTAQITQMHQEVDNIRSQYRAGNVQMSTLQTKQKEINKLCGEGDECKNQMTKELAALQDYHKSLNGTLDSHKIAQLGQEIDTLKKNISMLDNNNKQMAKMVNSLNVRG